MTVTFLKQQQLDLWYLLILIHFVSGGHVEDPATAFRQVCSSLGRLAHVYFAPSYGGEITKISITVLSLDTIDFKLIVWMNQTSRYSICHFSCFLKDFCQFQNMTIDLYICQVDWDSELECFESLSRETSEFYSMKKDWLEFNMADEVCRSWYSQYTFELNFRRV